VASAIVFGASGFIGAYVAAALRRIPETEVVDVARSARHAASAATIELDLLTADISAIAEVIAMSGATVVVNCAGTTTGAASELMLGNTVALARILEGMERAATGPRLIHMGSAAEYGAGPVGVKVSELWPARPLSSYGVSKFAATQLVVQARERGVLEGTVVRIFNAVGPGMPDHSLPGGVLGRMKKAVAEGSKNVATGPLDAVRDFVDVRDIAAAVAAACSAEEPLPPIINVGSGQGHTAREFVREIARRVGFDSSIKEESVGSPRSADVAWQVADIALASRTLGWRPTHDLASMCDFAIGGSGPDRAT